MVVSFATQIVQKNPVFEGEDETGTRSGGGSFPRFKPTITSTNIVRLHE